MIPCSFCGYTDAEARFIFAGPVVTIGGESVVLAICSCCVRFCEIQGHRMDQAERKREHERSRGRSVCEGWLFQGAV